MRKLLILALGLFLVLGLTVSVPAVEDSDEIGATIVVDIPTTLAIAFTGPAPSFSIVEKNPTAIMAQPLGVQYSFDSVEDIQIWMSAYSATSSPEWIAAVNFDNPMRVEVMSGPPGWNIGAPLFFSSHTSVTGASPHKKLAEWLGGGTAVDATATLEVRVDPVSFLTANGMTEYPGTPTTYNGGYQILILSL